MSNEEINLNIFLSQRLIRLNLIYHLKIFFIKIRTFWNTVITLLFSCLIFSCSLNDNSYNDIKIIRNITSDIDTLTIWNKSCEYVIQKSDFSVKDTLLIESGTIIKFNPDSSCSITISDNGAIIAQGSTSEHIVFTSLFDEKHSLANVSQKYTKSPNTGNWKFVFVNNHKNSFFDFCDFYYGGGGDQKSTIKIGTESSASITNCIFAYNDGGDLQSGNGVIDASQSSSETAIRSNTFFSNNLPLIVNTSYSMEGSNIFHNPLQISEINKYNCILVKSPSTINTSIVWAEDEVPYVIYGPNFDISPNASLVFGNNVVLKFMKNTVMKIEGPNSTLLNYDGPGVIFTSIFDDTHKGDTNGDGNLTSPKNGDWNMSVADNSTFEWTNILYALQVAK